MSRARRVYVCSACGFETPAFVGRCSRCGEWNTFTEAVAQRGPNRTAAPRVQMLSDVQESAAGRMETGVSELDRVLGGGLVAGSIVLVGGEPGIGKSTLVLQALAGVAARGFGAGYVCGEESPAQVRLRAGRLGLAEARIQLIAESSLDVALPAAREAAVSVLAVDSIQAVSVEGVDARVGGPAHLSEAGAMLAAWAKEQGVAVVVTGHVTKSGDIAGPRLLEHLVDAVLYFEGDSRGLFRILRAEKNRFGATDEVGVFEMTGAGLSSVENPALALTDAAGPLASGCALTAVLEGSRALTVEVQALAVPSFLASPRRVANGIESARLHLLLAVLARRGNLNAANLDVVATVSGGFRVRDPAADLAVLCALASAIRDVPLPPATAFVGEVALSGAIRTVPAASRRVAELARSGIRRCLVPPGVETPSTLEPVCVETVAEALHVALGRGP